MQPILSRILYTPRKKIQKLHNNGNSLEKQKISNLITEEKYVSLFYIWCCLINNKAIGACSYINNTAAKPVYSIASSAGKKKHT